MNETIMQHIKKQEAYLQAECPYKTCPFQCKFCCSAFEGQYPFEDKSLYLANKAEYFKRLDKIVQEHNITEIIVTGMTEPSLFQNYVNDMASFCKERGIESVLQTMDHGRGYENYDIVAYSIRDHKQMSKVPISDANTTRYTIVLSDEITDEALIDFIDKTKIKAEERGTNWQMTIKYLALTSNSHPTVDKYINDHRRTIEGKTLEVLKEHKVWIDDDCMNLGNTKPSYIFRQGGELFSHWGSKNPM